MHDLLDTPHVTEQPSWNKLRWLKSIVHKSITKHKDKVMYESCMGMMLYIERLQEMNNVPKKDLTKCNDILTYLQDKHKFKIDWRGDLIWDLLPKEWNDD